MIEHETLIRDYRNAADKNKHVNYEQEVVKFSSRGSSQSRDQTQVSHSAGRLPTELPGKPSLEAGPCSSVLSESA